MSRDARKKEKQRLKRKQKHREVRRAAGVTPLHRIARDGGQLECYVHAGWEEGGMATIQVLGHAPGGRFAHAAFLVDTWCVGLKDCFGHREITRGEFEEILDRMSDALDMEPLPAAEAKRLVAGAIRFSRRNGFRLPPHHERWTAIFGNLGDIDSADLTGFGIAGRGLRYVGDEQFLRRRLAGCSVEQFLARPDVQWVTPHGIPRDLLELVEKDLDDEEDDDLPGGLDFSDTPALAELARIVSSVGDRAEDAVRAWCFRTGQAPQPRLREAVDALFISALPAAMYGQAAEDDPSVLDVEEPPHPEELLGLSLGTLPPAERASLEAAMEQVAEFIRQFKDPNEMLEWLALPEDGPDADGDAPPFLFGGPTA